MNWTLIKEKYPKAHKKLGEWLDWDKHLEKYQHLLHNDRDLYDFFDEQGIYITVMYDGLAPFQAQITQEGKSENGSEYIWHLPDFRFSDTWKNYYKKYKTRTEAEEQAFLKAFSILEEKLC